MTVNERLRYVRKKLLCLTQAELADDLGIKESTVGSMERNGRNVTEQTLDAFAKAHEASKTEIALFKAFLCIEPTVRQTMLEQFKINLNQEEAISNLN